MGDEYMNRMEDFLANKEIKIDGLVNKKLEIEDKIVIDRLEIAWLQKDIDSYDLKSLNDQILNIMHENEKLV